MMNRREVLRILGAGAGLELLSAATPDALFALGQRVHADRDDVVVSLGARPVQTETIAAAAERIIPASETPGATDANVAPFIERMMSDWYSAAERDTLSAGLLELDARSHSLHGRTFVACDEAQQTALLQSFDDEVEAIRRDRARNVPGTPAPDQHWFSMFKYLTVWGYFTSEVAARETLHEFPLPGRYDGCAPYPGQSR